MAANGSILVTGAAALLVSGSSSLTGAAAAAGLGGTMAGEKKALWIVLAVVLAGFHGRDLGELEQVGNILGRGRPHEAPAHQCSLPYSPCFFIYALPVKGRAGACHQEERQVNREARTGAQR